MSDEEVQETEETEEVETPEVEVTTNDTINASLDEVDDPDVLKKMVKKLRGEAAKTRTEKNAKEAELTEFRAWKESQMTATEKAEQRAQDAEARLLEVTRDAVAKEFGLDDDLIEFLEGVPEDKLREKAEKLAKTTTQAEKNAAAVLPEGSGTNLRPGKRGTPVGKSAKDTNDGSQFFKDFWDDKFNR